MTHTAGPWRLDPALRAVEGKSIDGYKFICSPVRGGSVQEADANAHLIAAAPDMLAALREIERRDRGYVMPSDALDPSRIIEHQPGCNVLYMGEHAVLARAAIAKATGRSPQQGGQRE